MKNIIKSLFILTFMLTYFGVTASDFSNEVKEELALKMSKSESVNLLLKNATYLRFSQNFFDKSEITEADMQLVNQWTEACKKYNLIVQDEFPMYHSMNQTEKLEVIKRVLELSESQKAILNCCWTAVKSIKSCIGMNNGRQEYFFYACVGASIILDLGIFITTLPTGNAFVVVGAQVTLINAECSLCGKIVKRDENVILTGSCFTTFGTSMKACFGY